MPDDDISEQGLYELILRRLNEAGAEELASQTIQVVRRGAVVQGEDEAGEGKTKALRRMQPREALAVALEFLITALQVPLMIDKAVNTFECATITWHMDGPPDVVEAIETTNKAEAGLPFAENSDKRPDTEDLLPVSEPALRSDTAVSDLLMPIPLDFDLVAFESALNAVVDLKQELQLRFPEVV